ncbi:ABC transporter permease [Cribrihabitans pelagius]|uniref:ABC transporter permease n=1 Tax=Cribrihabitans pelagius TaxID=1765746 RepID=UPI003B5CB43D
MRRKTVRPGFWLVFRREVRWLIRRPFLVLLASIIPIAMFLILASVYARGIATELPIAVLDQDDSPGSRQLVHLVDAAPDIRIKTKVVDLEEAKRGILSGSYQGLLLVPENFTRDAMAGRRPEITFFYNTQMMVAGNHSARGVSSALPSIAAQVQAASRMARGMTADQAAIAVQPVAMDAHGLFNPALDYSHFLLAALVVAVLQLTTSLATCYSVALDVETPHSLRILRRLGGGIVPAVLGKLLPLTIVACLVHAVCDIIMFGYFGLPLDGSGWLLALSALVFLLSCQILGALAALFIGAPPPALSVLALTVSPSFGYLGVSFPREAMNAFSIWWGNIFPATPYVSLRIDQTVRGGPVDVSLAILHHQFVYLAVAVSILLFILVRIRRKAATAGTQPPGQAAAPEV